MGTPLPTEFTNRIRRTFGSAGDDFLRELPARIVEATRRWGLDQLHPAKELSYNFIAFARRTEVDVVLKIGVRNRELASEIHALRLFDGHACVQLIDADEDRGMLLLERLRPGAQLIALQDDARATCIAADIMLALRRSAPHDAALIQLSYWFRTLALPHTGVPKALQVHAQTTVARLFAADPAPMLMHGDLHHFNILSSGNAWRAIDPKGVVGPALYEVGPFLVNPWLVRGVDADTPRFLDERIRILAERLGARLSGIRGWAFAHAVLSACWSSEEGDDVASALALAALLAR